MVKDFNEYSEKNNLNITLNVNIYTSLDMKSFEDFADNVESLLRKKTNKYDIYYFDNAYTIKYGPHLLDLKNYLPEEHIKMFNSEIIEKSCLYEDKLVGLPYNLAYSMLYSNYLLLDKYNRTIPETWDELKETAKYIMERENDPDLIPYNGFFD
eukprot:jgi/Orpsp1_1/1174354/evm.model.c7180000049786.1